MATQLAEIRGTILRITHEDPETQFYIIKIETASGEKTVKVTSVVDLFPGHYIYCQGSWESSNWGPTFKALKIQVSKPTKKEGMEKYLAKAVKGIGPKNAKRLIDAFGEKVFEVIEQEPESLTKIDGIGKAKAAAIIEAYKKEDTLRDLSVFLYQLGLSGSKATKVYELWGEGAKHILQENPYELCNVWGIGFKSADEAALKQGIPKDSPYRIRAAFTHMLKQAESEGKCGVPRATLIDDCSEMLGQPYAILNEILESEVTLNKIVEFDLYNSPCMFTPSIFNTEKAIARFVINQVEKPVANIIENIDEKIQEQSTNLGLAIDGKQLEAVKLALNSQLCILTGGPGTGKTTITKIILNTFAKYLPHIELSSGRVRNSQSCKIAIVAPTGKAAKRAREATGFNALTIHRLLEVGPNGTFKKNAENQLDLDVLAIDESSMMDVYLTLSLFCACAPHTRIIIIGDKDQLDSVGPGKVLKDLLDSNVVPFVKLDKIRRTGANSFISENAFRINQGLVPQDSAGQEGADFFLIKTEYSQTDTDDEKRVKRQKMQNDVLRIVLGLAKKGMDPIKDVQVLAPMKPGMLGTHALNILLQTHLNKNAPAEKTINATLWKVNDKVMQIRNNYEKDVFNGDIGYIKQINDKFMVIEFDERQVEYLFNEMDELMLAYAYTIHKSQGSEVACLVMPLDTSHFMMLKRNLFYTGVTRSKKKCYVVGPTVAQKLAVENDVSEERYSCLGYWLKNKSKI